MPFTEPRTRTVVVGYDGSAASRAAVEHAIVRTGPDGHLVIVHAFQVPPEYVGAPYYEDAMGRTTERAATSMDALERDCQALATVDYETDVIQGRPGDVICRVAARRRAQEIVVGTRGVGRVRGILGSVAHDVLHQATCPVLVIPERIVGRHETAATAIAGA